MIQVIEDILNAKETIMLPNPDRLVHIIGLEIQPHGSQFVAYNEEGDLGTVAHPFCVENVVIGLMALLSNNLRSVPLNIPSLDGSESFALEFYTDTLTDENGSIYALVLCRIDGDEYLLSEIPLTEHQYRDEEYIFRTINQLVWALVNTITKHMVEYTNGEGNVSADTKTV